MPLHSYQQAFQHLPSAMGGTARGRTDLAGDANRMSGIVAFLDQNIDVGEANQTALAVQQLTAISIPSPHGIWGALGTIAGNENLNGTE